MILSVQQRFRGHVSFRDSKLTRILKNSLGGNAKTTIICNVTPVSLEETNSTLGFAQSAKKIQNKPVLNTEYTQKALLKRLESDMEQWKADSERIQSALQSDKMALEADKTALEARVAELAREKERVERMYNLTVRQQVTGAASTTLLVDTAQQKANRGRRYSWAPGQAAQSPKQLPHRLTHRLLPATEEALNESMSVDEWTSPACATDSRVAALKRQLEMSPM